MADGLGMSADFLDFLEIFDLEIFDLETFDLETFDWAVVGRFVDFDFGWIMGRVLDRGDEREIFLFAQLRYPKPISKVTPTVSEPPCTQALNPKK